MRIRPPFRRQSTGSLQSQIAASHIQYKNNQDDNFREQSEGNFAREGIKNYGQQDFAFGHRPKMWNPIWLQKRVIFSLTFVCVTCAISLMLLLYFDRRYHGFPLLTLNHYSWTYGPTAILVLIVAIWRQVDQFCKALTPWATMGRGEATAEQSVLLDYVSPLQAVSFIQAIKNRHVAVIGTILGFVTLKLVTLASTGLFFTESTILSTSDTDLLVKSKLDGTLFNSTAAISLSDPSIFYTAYAVMMKGLADADGIQGGLLYEKLEASTDKTSNITFSSNVDVFVPSFNCIPSKVEVVLQPANTTDHNPEDKIKILSPACVPFGTGVSIYALNPQMYQCPSRQLSGLMQRVNCSGADIPGSEGNWELLTMTDMRYNQNVINASSSNFTALSWSTVAANMSSILCRPGYTVQTRKVTYDMSTSPPHVTLAANGSGNHTLNGFVNEDLQSLFASAYLDAALMFGNKLGNELAFEYPDTLFTTMAQVIGGSYESLLDPVAMSTAAETVFQHVAVQIANRLILRPTQVNTTGDLSWSEERLRIRSLSLWLMFSGFVALALLSIFIIFVRPKDALPRNPESIGTMALILAYSPDFELLLNIHMHTGDKLEKIFDEYVFTTIQKLDGVGKCHFILDVAKLRSGYTTIVGGRSNHEWWRPLFIQKRILAAVFVLPVLVIAMLEMLQILSNRSAGIVVVEQPESLGVQASTRFLPAIVVLMVATMFNALDFNITVLAPYQALRKDATTADRSILSTLLGTLSPMTLFLSVKHRHWSAFFSAIAAFLGSFLTIIVSGLYTVDNLPLSITSQVNILDDFNPNWSNSVLNDSSAAVVASLIEAANLTYPPFTYQDLAFPKVDFTQLQNNASENLLFLTLPALRASLECETLAQNQFDTVPSVNPRILSSGVTVNGSMNLPPDCLFGGPDGNLSTLDFEYSFQFPNTNASFIGKMLDLHVGPFSGPVAASSDEFAPYDQPDNPPGCPSLAFIYGYFDVNNAQTSNISVMVCNQVIQQLQTNLTFSLPNLEIDVLHPPIVDESSASYLKSSGDGKQTAFPYRLEVNMDESFSMFNQTEFSSASSSARPVVDNFFQGAIFGRSPIPQAALANPSAQETIQGSLQGMYRRYMAQVISANMRIPISATTPNIGTNSTSLVSKFASTAVPAQILNATQSCVRQNVESKIALEVLLGLMLICGILATTLNPMRELLPYNPCTIAGAAALLAGSELSRPENLQSDHEGSVQWASDRELMDSRTGIWRNRKFQLGWWVGARIEQSNIGIGLSSRRYGIDSIEGENDDLST